jgi:hypothetical protein
MEAMRESWTDERLDDLKGEVGSLRAEFGELRRETGAEFRAVRGEIAGLHRLILQVGGGMFVTMLIGFLGIAIQL